MNADRLNELAALEALGLLTEAEHAEFLENVTRADAPTRAGIARLNDALAAVAVAQSPGKSAPANLKAKVLVQIPGTPQAKAAKPHTDFYDIRSHEGEWRILPVPGVRVKDLSQDPKRGLAVKMYELAPGAHFPEHHHTGPEECFILSGDFHIEGKVLHGGDFHHAEAHSDHGESFTEGGCKLLVMVATADHQ